MKFDDGFCFILANACRQRQFICRRPASRQFNCAAHLLITAEILRQIGKLLSALIKAFGQTASLFLNIAKPFATCLKAAMQPDNCITHLRQIIGNFRNTPIGKRLIVQHFDRTHLQSSHVCTTYEIHR